MNEPVIEPVQLVRMEIRDAARSAARELGYANLKPEQLDVVEAFVKGRDVFAVLPTGYGKSLCFGCLPLGHYKSHSWFPSCSQFPVHAGERVRAWRKLRHALKQEVSLKQQENVQIASS